MNYILTMHVSHRLNNLLEYFLHLILITDSRPGPLPNILIQIIAIDIFNNNVDLVTRINSIIELHNAFMLQFAQRVYFISEAVDSNLVLTKLGFVILFNGHLFMGSFQSSTLNYAEGSLADQHLDIVIFQLRLVWAVQLD